MKQDIPLYKIGDLLLLTNYTGNDFIGTVMSLFKGRPDVVGDSCWVYNIFYMWMGRQRTDIFDQATVFRCRQLYKLKHPKDYELHL